MICCDGCDEWYHLECVGLTKPLARQMPEYTCPKCKAKEESDKKKKERGERLMKRQQLKEMPVGVLELSIREQHGVPPGSVLDDSPPTIRQPSSPSKTQHGVKAEVQHESPSTPKVARRPHKRLPPPVSTENREESVPSHHTQQAAAATQPQQQKPQSSHKPSNTAQQRPHAHSQPRHNSQHQSPQAQPTSGTDPAHGDADTQARKTKLSPSLSPVIYTEAPQIGEECWRGCINKQSIGKFNVIGYHLLGAPISLTTSTGILAETLSITGRLDIEKLTTYIGQLASSGSRKRTLIRLAPESEKDVPVFNELCTYFHGRNRAGFIDFKQTNSPPPPEIYIIPVVKNEPFPVYLSEDPSFDAAKGFPGLEYSLIMALVTRVAPAQQRRRSTGGSTSKAVSPLVPQPSAATTPPPYPRENAAAMKSEQAENVQIEQASSKTTDTSTTSESHNISVSNCSATENIPTNTNTNTATSKEDDENSNISQTETNGTATSEPVTACTTTVTEDKTNSIDTAPTDTTHSSTNTTDTIAIAIATTTTVAAENSTAAATSTNNIEDSISISNSTGNNPNTADTDTVVPQQSANTSEEVLTTTGASELAPIITPTTATAITDAGHSEPQNVETHNSTHTPLETTNQEEIPNF